MSCWALLLLICWTIWTESEGKPELSLLPPLPVLFALPPRLPPPPAALLLLPLLALPGLGRLLELMPEWLLRLLKAAGLSWSSKLKTVSAEVVVVVAAGLALEELGSAPLTWSIFRLSFCRREKCYVM